MKPKLHSLYIYLTDQCNLNCIHCWQSAPLAGHGNYSSLRFDECRAFLDDAVAMGLRSIIFSGGEPLLNPDFHQFARYFFDNKVAMTVETNGILLSQKKVLDTIRRFNIYCAISLDGASADTHNRHRCSDSAFEDTVLSIKKLEKNNHHYQIIMAVSKFNYHELSPLLDWVKDNCGHCDKVKINVVNDLGRGEIMNKKGLLFHPEEYTALSDDVAPLIDGYPFDVSLHVDPVFVSFKNLMLQHTCGGYCGYLAALSILANGNISICSMGKQVPKYVFGHVSTINVRDVWENHPQLLDLHENTQLRLEGICSNCIFRKRCAGGCRAEALHVYGDFFAPHPRCQAYYDTGKFPDSRLIDPSKNCSYP